jgi:hypothetical protein
VTTVSATVERMRHAAVASGFERLAARMTARMAVVDQRRR